MSTHDEALDRATRDAFRDMQPPLDGLDTGPYTYFEAGMLAGIVRVCRKLGLCVGCYQPFTSPDHDLRCSSCAESGTGFEPKRHHSSQLVSHEEALRIGKETRADFEKAVVDAGNLGRELDALARTRRPP